MAEFDIVSKHLFKEYTDDFVRFTLNRRRFRVLEVIDTELPTVESRHTDVLARVQIGAQEVLAHTEFQVGDSTTIPMPRRIAGYTGRLVESLGIPVCSTVIYLRPTAGRSDPGRYSYRRGEFRFNVSYRVIRLIEMSGEEVIQQKLWGLLPFAPLMQPPQGMSAESWLRQCVQATDEVSLDNISKANFLTDLAILSGLVYNYETILNIISEELMYESVVAQKLAERATQQGLQQGHWEEQLFSVHRLISRKFSQSDADRIKSSLESIQELGLLRQVFDKAIDVQTIDELQKTVDMLIKS